MASSASAENDTASEIIQTLKTNPNDAANQRRLGLLLWREKKLVEALIQFRKILVIDRRVMLDERMITEARFAIAGIEFERHHDAKAWEELFDLAFRAGKISGHSNPIDLRFFEKRWRDFPPPFDGTVWSEIFERCAETVRRDAGYRERAIKSAQVSLETRGHEKALRIYTRLVVLEPRNHEYRLLRGAALSSRKRDEEATRDYKEAILLEPRNPRGYKGLALVQARRGEKDAARDAYEQVLRIDPADEEARTWLAVNA
jgi:tetratricopeptide (TPR) repeat protein